MYILKTFIKGREHTYTTRGFKNCSGCDCETPCDIKQFNTIEAMRSVKYHEGLDGAFYYDSGLKENKPLY